MKIALILLSAALSSTSFASGFDDLIKNLEKINENMSKNLNENQYKINSNDNTLNELNKIFKENFQNVKKAMSEIPTDQDNEFINLLGDLEKLNTMSDEQENILKEINGNKKERVIKKATRRKNKKD